MKLRRARRARKQTEFMQPEAAGRYHKGYDQRPMFAENRERMMKTYELNLTMVPVPKAFAYVMGLPFHRNGTTQAPNIFYAYVASGKLGSKDTFTWDEVMSMDDRQQWLESAEVEVHQL